MAPGGRVEAPREELGAAEKGALAWDCITRLGHARKHQSELSDSIMCTLRHEIKLWFQLHWPCLQRGWQLEMAAGPGTRVTSSSSLHLSIFLLSLYLCSLLCVSVLLLCPSQTRKHIHVLSPSLKERELSFQSWDLSPCSSSAAISLSPRHPRVSVKRKKKSLSLACLSSQ